MTKTPRRLSIASVAPAEEENVATSQRHDVDALQHESVATLQSHDVATSQRRPARKGASHSSFYASPKVLKALREIALARDCKVNDLILEGLRPILARDGRDLDDLNRDG